MKHYHNWPNLKLVYLVTYDKTDEWGLPIQSTHEVKIACKRNVQSLKHQDRLSLERAKALHPDALTIELVDVKWLGRPLESSDPRCQPVYTQSELLF